jgi:hypothetical protein
VSEEQLAPVFVVSVDDAHHRPAVIRQAVEQLLLRLVRPSWA